jgi:hypothetical protein
MGFSLVNFWRTFSGLNASELNAGVNPVDVGLSLPAGCACWICLFRFVYLGLFVGA